MKRRKYFHKLPNEVINDTNELKKLNIYDYKEPSWCILPLSDGCMSLFNGLIKRRMDCIACEYCKGYNISQVVWMRAKMFSELK